MKKYYLFLIFLLILSNISFADKNLVILPVKSSVVDLGSLNYFEVELYRSFSTILDLDVKRSLTLDNEFYYYSLSSSITAENDKYTFEYNFYDVIKQKSIYEGNISESSINEITGKFNDGVLYIRSILRKPPDVNKKLSGQIVIGTGIIGSDIFVNDVYIGSSPVSYTADIGSELTIEARTESFKKFLTYTIEDSELREINLELEPITGSFLLRGDVLGRTLYVNDDPLEIVNSYLFRNIPIGKVFLNIDSEWGIWEDTIFIEEGKLSEINVEFQPIGKIDIDITNGVIVNIKDFNGNDITEINESQLLIVAPGDYEFISRKDGYVPDKTYMMIDAGIFHSYITPELEEVIIEVTEPVVDLNEIIKPKLTPLESVHKASFWGSVGSGALLCVGIISEIITINLYENETLSQELISLRETGESLSIINLTQVRHNSHRNKKI